MRTEALDRAKLVFGLFDVDGNGFIEANDFDLMAKNVIQAVPEAGDGPKSAMLEGFQEFWEALITDLDANHDNKISYDEFTAIALSPESFDEALGVFASSLSNLGDLDGDGKVRRPVFLALMTAIGFEVANINALFDSLEPDDADRIAAAVWETEIKKYYDPELGGIPADHLVGPPKG
jgi:EF-hand domain pair